MKHLTTACKLAACAGLTSALLVTGSASADTTVTAGVAVPVNDPSNAPLKLPNGPNTSTFDFGLTLPAQASCPGDTESGNYHIDSFIIPASANPASVTYSDGVPVVSGKTYVNLVTSEGEPYNLINTAVGTGEIPVPLPYFSFSREFRSPTPTIIPTGNYLAGIACATGAGDTASYWDSFVSVNQSKKTTTFQKHAAVITAISPGTLDQGASAKTLTLTGFDLTGGTVTVSGSGVTLSKVTVVNPEKITASATVSASAATGTRTVTVKATAGTTTTKLKIAS